ncbi:MAG: hypothetical protein DBY04_00525 [Clostridiales bacterium]|nr:MAG: hypothetical protein DBY04_00525 [Clostridiales bacterium]
MKRFLALVLSLAMILTVFLMAGCGDGTTETTSSTSTSGTTGSESGTEESTPGTSTETAETTRTDSTPGTTASTPDDTSDETTGSTSTSGTTGSESGTEESTPGTSGGAVEPTRTDSTPGTSASTSGTTAELDGYNKLDGFEDVDFGGATFTIAAVDDDGIWNEVYSSEADTISVAVQQRNKVIESLYNCNIEVMIVGDPYSFAMADRMNGQETIQAYMVQFGGKPRAESGENYNLYNLGINFENPWWDQTYVNSFRVRKNNGSMALYLAVGDFALTTFNETRALIVNNTVLENSPITDDIYELVRNHEWTMDKFVEMIKAIAASQGGNYNRYWSEGDIMGWVRTSDAAHALHVASGLSIIENNDGVMNFAASEHLAEWDSVIDKAISLWNMDETQGVEDISPLIVHEVAKSSNVLFFSAGLDVLREADGASVSVVPYPLYSTSQENYAHFVDNSFCAYAVPTTVSNPAAMGQFLEVYAFHSRYLVRPAWVDAYSSEYCSNPNAAEMLEIILDTRTYDPGYLWWSQYESSFSGFVENAQNEVSRWNDRNAATIQNDINTFVEKISSREN